MSLLALPLLDSGSGATECRLPSAGDGRRHAIYKRPHSHLKHSDVVLSRLAILSHPSCPTGNIEASHGDGSGISSG